MVLCKYYTSTGTSFVQLLRGLVPCAHRAIFKRLSLGGYGGLRYIKIIWVDSSSPGDMGAEVAAQWRAKREAMRGEERAQLKELVTTVIRVPGEEEPRIITRNIPATMSDMVEKAGRDNNHQLQKGCTFLAAATIRTNLALTK